MRLFYTKCQAPLMEWHQLDVFYFSYNHAASAVSKIKHETKPNTLLTLRLGALFYV